MTSDRYEDLKLTHLLDRGGFPEPDKEEVKPKQRRKNTDGSTPMSPSIIDDGISIYMSEQWMHPTISQSRMIQEADSEVISIYNDPPKEWLYIEGEDSMTQRKSLSS